jgi:hypothetical protein
VFLFKISLMKNLNLLIITLISFTTNAEETTTSKNAFKGTRFVNVQSANLTGGAYEFFGLNQACMRNRLQFATNVYLGTLHTNYW